MDSTPAQRVAVHSTAAQRVGILFAFVEACAFGFVAALHLGLKVTVAGASFSAPFLYAAAIVEGLLALALLFAVILPGDSGVRAGRVLAAQILAVIGIFVNQIALLRGALLGLAREEIFYGVALALALASLALVASPVVRRGAIIRESEIRPTNRSV
jgi:hypothetical protein